MRSLLWMLGFVGLWLAPLPSVHAQTTDQTQIAHARELGNAGVRLQEQGRYAEALEKFQAAHNLYPEAATVTIRMAQCQRALGKWIESGESYRKLLSTPLPPSSPPAFKQAQEQGKIELESLDKLIPTLTFQIDPTPPPQGTKLHVQRINKEGPPTVEVLDAAWINTPRKVNPGTYVIFATAPGYASKTKQLTLAESDRKVEQLTLSAGEEAPEVDGDTTEVPGPNEPPKPYEVAPKAASNTARPFGLVLGFGGGINSSTGDGVGGTSGTGNLHAYFRIKKLMLGATFQYDHLSGNDAAGYVGLHVGLLTSTQKVGIWLDGGIGAQVDAGRDNSEAGPALKFAIGPSFPIGKVVRLIPKGFTGIGSMPEAHVLFGLMLDLQFEVGLGKKPSATAMHLPRAPMSDNSVQRITSW